MEVLDIIEITYFRYWHEVEICKFASLSHTVVQIVTGNHIDISNTNTTNRFKEIKYIS